MGKGGRRYKRRKVWVNAGFQARYTAMIVAVAVAILAVLGTLYVRTLEEQTRLMGTIRVGEEAPGGAGIPGEDFNRELQDKARETEDRPRVLGLFGVAALLVVALAYVGIRMTFRAAGPVFAVSRMLRNMAMGQFAAIRPLRKGDEFRFLGEDVAALRDSLRREAHGDITLLERAVETLSSLPPPEGAADRALVSELVGELREAARGKEERFGRGAGGPAAGGGDAG